MKYLSNFIIAAGMCLFLTACADNSYENNNFNYSNMLSSWVRVNYPDRIDKTTESGTYILENSEGNGTQVTKGSYVFIHYVKKDLDGDIIATNYEKIDEQIGSYSRDNYYGSDIWQLGEGYVPVGIEEALTGARVGAKMKIAVPLSASTINTVYYNAFNGIETGNAIYDIEIDNCVNDIKAYEIEQLEQFRRVYYPDLDSVLRGMYFKKHNNAGADADTISDGATINIRYVGKLLNGQVFDTNIKDTAKFYRIYNESNKYSSLAITFKEDMKAMITGNTCIEGFSRAVREMKVGEAADTFFWSDFGYLGKGSDKKIPEYAPLHFTIYILEEDN